MRVILIGLAVLVVLIVGAIIIGPSLIPSSVYRDQITAAVEKATGRQFQINGPVSLRIFPTVEASVSAASLGNSPGGTAKDMADIGRLDVGLALFPLLSHHAEIKSFVLNDPVIHLEVDKSGKTNWNFAAAPSAAGASAPTPSQPSAGNNALSELSLGDVRLVNGLITYQNKETGGHYELSGINAKVALPSLDQPLKFDGDAVYNAQKLTVSAALTKPRAAMDGGTTAVTAKVGGDPLSASFNGNVTFGAKPQFAGVTKLDVPSVRRLSAWLGNPMQGSKGFGALSIAGNVSFTGNAFAFQNADLKFDAIHATGGVKGDLSGKIPYINASLNTDNLDLRPYIEQSAGSLGGGGAAGASAAASAPAGASWSSAPIDASALKAFNADFAFNAGQILVRDLTIGKSVLALSVKSGVMTADLKQLALYGGSGKGTVTLNAQSPALEVSSNLALTGLDLASFMKAAAKTSRFEGTGAFNIDVHGAGASQKAIVSSLDGNAAIDFKNGAIKGVDLTKIAAVVNSLLGKKTDGQTQATDVGQSASDETKFVAMGGTFAIANGVATTNDFKMINDLVSLSGSGSIDLPAQSIDFRVDPGKSQSDGGLKVALLIKGPLAKPKITPDLTGLVENQLNKTLSGLLGGKSKTKQMQGQTGATPSSQGTPAQQILKGIFGQ